MEKNKIIHRLYSTIDEKILSYTSIFILLPLIYNYWCFLDYLTFIAAYVSYLYWMDYNNMFMSLFDNITASALAITYKYYQFNYIYNDYYYYNILPYELLTYYVFIMNKWYQYDDMRWILYHGLFHIFCGIFQYKVKGELINCIII